MSGNHNHIPKLFPEPVKLLLEPGPPKRLLGLGVAILPQTQVPVISPGPLLQLLDLPGINSGPAPESEAIESS